MVEIVKVDEEKIGGATVKTVNARELHAFLESKQDFSTWIKSRIEKYGFDGGSDYICLHKKMEANNATMIEYHIAFDMAKELLMVENNEKGRNGGVRFMNRYLVAWIRSRTTFIYKKNEVVHMADPYNRTRNIEEPDDGTKLDTTPINKNSTVNWDVLKMEKTAPRAGGRGAL